MSYTKHYDLPILPTGTVDWLSLFNDLANKVEVGRTLLLTAGETLNARDPFYIKSDGKAWKADNTTNVYGIWQSVTTAASALGYGQVKGTMTYGSWTWTPGGLIYVNVSKTLTQTASSSGVVVAVAISATEISLLTNIVAGVSSFNSRVGGVVPATNDYTWAQIDKTTSDIANITTKSHTSLTDIGTNAHAAIDTHIAHFSMTTGKVLSVLKTMSFTSADDTGVYTLPTGTKTIPANTDVLYVGTTSIALNRASAAQDLAGITSLTPGADFTLNQNSVAVMTSVNSGAIVNTLYLKTGLVGIANGAPHYNLDIGGTAPKIGYYSDATHYGFFQPYSDTGGMVFDHNDASTGGIHFQYAGADLMTILDGGSVGIGTSPSVKFHMFDSNTSSGNTPYYFAYLAGQNDSGTPRFRLGMTGNLDVAICGLNVNIEFFGGTSGTTQTMKIGSNGGAVQMNGYGAGTATFDASGNITSVSDEIFKNIQGDFTVGLAEILKINPILYKWKPESNLETENIYAGFSAQNVLQYIPEAVGCNGRGQYSLSDRPIIAALVNAVKELQKEIDVLKTKNGIDVDLYYMAAISDKKRLILTKYKDTLDTNGNLVLNSINN